MESRITDGPPWLHCLSAASHLPLTIWIPQGSDQKAHAGLSLVCSKKNLLTRKGKSWGLWPPPSANMPKMEPRANFPNHSFHSQGRFANNPSYRLHFSRSPVSSLPEELGVGDLVSLLKVLICLVEAVVSSSFTVLREVRFLTLRCVDVLEDAQ